MNEMTKPVTIKELDERIAYWQNSETINEYGVSECDRCFGLLKEWKADKLIMAKNLMNSWLFVVNNPDFSSDNVYFALREIEVAIKDIIGNDYKEWEKLKRFVERKKQLGGGEK
jgi:hypothetical protein